MHNYIIFILTLFYTCSNQSLLAMQKSISLPNYEYITNSYTDIVGYRLRYYPGADIYVPPLGEKLFSNVCNNKVFTMIDCGSQERSPHCYTSLLDLETVIDRPYENLKMRTTACHLLDSQTPIVGYHKLFFLREKCNITRLIKNIYEQPRVYTLEIAQTLQPFLAAENQTASDDVHISTIDSCDTHLFAIASNGFITTWEKPDSIKDIKDNSRKKGYCAEPFFSAGFNKKEKVICLGLNNGKIFVTSLMDLKNSKIINLFPQPIQVNWISVSENNFLCAGVCKTKKEMWQNRYTNNEVKPVCCRKTTFPPQACLDCKDRYQKEMNNMQRQMTGNLSQITACIAEIRSKIEERCKTDCEHTKEDRENNCLPDICNACRNTSYYTVISAAQLKENTLEKNIIPYNTNDNRVQAVAGFHLIDDQEIIFAYKKNCIGDLGVELKSLKSEQNIDFIEKHSSIQSLSSLVLLPRENGYYSIMIPGSVSTNKPDTIHYINKSVRKIISKAPYYWAPIVAPIEFIISFIKTPQLSLPTFAALGLFLYRQYHCAHI